MAQVRMSGSGDTRLKLETFPRYPNGNETKQFADAAEVSAAAALASEESADADAIATAADRVQTGQDKASTSANAILAAQAAADAAGHESGALTAKAAADADAAATAADRVQTGVDRSGVATDRAGVATDRAAVAADRTQTGLDRTQTGSDVLAANTAAATAQFAAGQATASQSGVVAYETYAGLAADATSSHLVAGQQAFVPLSDGGTHTDPVVGGTVPNAGIYRYSTSPAGWRWIAAQAVTQDAVITSARTIDATKDATSGLLRGVDQFGRDVVPYYSKRARFFTGRDANGNRQIFVRDGGGRTQLTYVGNNEDPELLAGGGVRFTSDRRGFPEDFVMSEDGMVQTSVAASIYQNWVYDGQSLSNGTQPSPATPTALTTTNVTPNAWMLTTNAGVAPYGPRSHLDDTSTPKNVDKVMNVSGRVTGIEPLREAVADPASQGGATLGETPCAGFAAQFMKNTNAAHNVVLINAGRGSAAWVQPTDSVSPLVELQPRSVHFANKSIMGDIARRSVKMISGAQFQYGGTVCHWGEVAANANPQVGGGVTYAQCISQLSDWVSANNRHFRGQSRYHRQKRMYLSQVSSFVTVQPGAFEIARAQADAPLTNPLLVCIGPKYDLTYVDTIHGSAASYRFQGERDGKWARRVEREGLAPVAFVPVKAVLSGSKIRVTFNVPWGLALVIDTTTVAAYVVGGVTTYGLRYYDNAASGITITSVVEVGDGRSVDMNLSAPPNVANAPYVTVADSPTTNSTSGPTSGARSNFRNAETEVGELSGRPLYDWACHYKIFAKAA